MLPQTQPRKRRNSSKVNLLISFAFHAAIVLTLVYFAAREGLLGRQLKKIAVEMVKEKPPEKPKEPEKPKPEPPKVEPPKVEPQKVAVAPKAEPSRAVTSPPAGSSVAAPPPAAPPAVEVPSFVFEGGKAVESVSDPVQLYKGFVEYALRSKWDRPVDVPDKDFVAEVEVSVDRTGRVSNPEWKKTSGHTRWDASVRAALAATTSISRQPPTNFPPRVLVRFDVQEVTDAFAP
jgi:hypothetical protein